MILIAESKTMASAETEVSREEYFCYTTEETEKIQVLNKAAQLGGSVEAAIKMLANERREGAT